MSYYGNTHKIINTITTPECHQTTELTRTGSYISLTRAETCPDNPTPTETDSVINSLKSEVLFDYNEEYKKEEANGKKKKKNWKETYCATGMRRTLINIIVLSCLLAGVAYLSFTEFYPRYQEAAKEDLKRTRGTNSTHVNATNKIHALQQRQVSKVILPLWTKDVNEVKRDSPFVIPTVPPFPGAKAECSMSKKNQCYTGHKCYKRYCVPWCRDNSDCFEGHICLRADLGTSWKVCSLEADVQVPCVQNYKYCKEDNDCCTGSCQHRGKYKVCVPPEKFEHPVKGNDIKEEVSTVETKLQNPPHSIPY